MLIKILINLPIKLGEDDTSTTTANDNLSKNNNRKILSKEKAEIFHTITAKGIYFCRREIPDIQPIIAIL